jgi:hypothetical protein
MLQDHYIDGKTLDEIEDTRSKNRGITQCDLGYQILFDPKDYEKLFKFYQYIRLARQLGDLNLKNELVQYHEQFLARKYQDKTVSYEFIPEPYQIGFKPDRVVFNGLERIADLTTGISGKTFKYYAIGTGTTSVLPSDQFLDFEEHRVSIGETGYAESKGSSMVFAANFPTTLQSMSVTEAAIFDGQQFGATMLLRTLYEGTNVIPHVFNQTFVAVSHFVYQLSV